MNIELKGKTVLVTGASGQIGSVIAKTLANCGADVIIHYYKNKKRAQALKGDIEKSGVSCFLVQADITEKSDVLAMKKAIMKNFKLPEILVNSAVIQNKWGSVIEQDPEVYIQQFNSSVMHNVYMIKSFIPDMIEKKYGRVISINTECAMQCFANSSAYIVGKRGMDGLLRVLTHEVGAFNITVNQIAPGWTITERERSDGTMDDTQYSSKVPLKRRGTDQEIANVVAFIASDLASFISGAFIPVCGGNIMPAI